MTYWHLEVDIHVHVDTNQPLAGYMLHLNGFQRSHEKSVNRLLYVGRVEHKLELDGKYQLKIRADTTGIKGYPTLLTLNPRLAAYSFLIYSAVVRELVRVVD